MSPPTRPWAITAAGLALSTAAVAVVTAAPTAWTRALAAVVLVVLGGTGAASWAFLRAQRHVVGELRRREARFRSLVHNTSGLVTVVDPGGRIRYLSPSVETLLGYAPDSLMGRSLADILHPDDADAIEPFLREMLAEPEATASIEWRLRHRDGSHRHVDTEGANLLDDADVAGLVLNIRDISERKALERRLSYQAFHDPLTNLANRSLFADRVRHACARAAREGRSLAIALLDLDNFKDVNDSLGHAAGDELLVILARRLEACIRGGDTAARLGGDEFALLLEPPTDAAGAMHVAERLLEALRDPVRLHGTEVVPAASVGIVVSPAGRENVDALLRNADIAMYRAKGSGKGRCAVFESSMHAAVIARLELEAELQRAVERDELVLHYQPTVELHSGRINGVEALVRWAHPRHGLLPPGRFVPLAEDTGLITDIGRWVLAEACRQVRDWQERFPRDEPLTVHVNLSARQLDEHAFVADVERALRDTLLAPDRLVLEITETAMVDSGDAHIDTLQALDRLGVRLALDDFGTGYASLGALKELPLDVLKIDKMFIDAILGGPEDVAFAHAIISLSDILGLDTVAEGIERPEQAARLRALGCQLGQGFLFARPLEVSGVEAALRAGDGVVARR